jgi:hypothetical protein
MFWVKGEMEKKRWYDTCVVIVIGYTPASKNGKGIAG